MRGCRASTAAENYRQNAWDLFILNQHKEDLTYLGRQDYKFLRGKLNQSRSNFRYRVLDMETGQGAAEQSGQGEHRGPGHPGV